jgi:alkylation response protein AidB-like acyl-CoA dehydrogenase
MCAAQGTSSERITEPGIRTELVSRITALQGLVRGHADQAEAQRRVPDVVIEALTEAGMFRLLTPRRYGGYQTGLRTLVEAVESLGLADGSTAWQAALQSTGSAVVCRFPEQAQQEVFGASPDVRITGQTAQPGDGLRVAGGWRVSGRWSYCSGSWHANWVLAPVALAAGDAGPVGISAALIPASELVVEETWFAVGMSATASNTMVAREVFVPEHRVLSMTTLLGGDPSPDGVDALIRSGFGPVGYLAILGPLLGIGRAALAWVAEQATSKALAHTPYRRQADSVGVQVQLGEAAVKMESARLHTYRAVEEIDSAASQGAALDYPTRARIRAEAGYAAQLIVGAVTTLQNAHGSGGFAESSPLRRYAQDVHTGARHAALNSAIGYEVLGKSLTGVPDRVSDMV